MIIALSYIILPAKPYKNIWKLNKEAIIFIGFEVNYYRSEIIVNL
jgi:hypothetical protein